MVQPGELLKTLVNTPRVTVERFERVTTSLDEIFLHVVEQNGPREPVDAGEEATA